MFNPVKYAFVYDLPLPMSAPVGVLLLSNGVRMVGNWVWYPTSGMGKFVEDSGQVWVVNVADVVAFSPQAPVVTPTGPAVGGPLDASQGA